MVLKFAGIDSISEAEALIGSELQILASERVVLEPGSAYLSELVGATLWDGDREVGHIKDVRFGAGEAPLLVVSGKGTRDEYEIPYAAVYLKHVNLEAKAIHMLLPEGMLDVNAPLTDEEKQEQRHKLGRS